MALPNIFRKKSIEEKGKKVETERKEKSRQEKKEKKEAETTRISKKTVKKVSEIASRVLAAPHVTEKATELISKNQYVFKVFQKANKIEIKKAIEEIYGVDVLKVRIIRIPRKPRRMGRISGWRKGYKKAIVKIKEGQKIEILSR